MLDAVSARPAKESLDLDLDGREEVFLHNEALQAVVRMDGSAAICELDAYRLKHNFGDTLMRQTEHYHRKVHASGHHEHNGDGIANPHERISFKHEIFEEDLATDTHPKSLFIDKWQEGDQYPQTVCYEPTTGRGASLAFKSRVGGHALQKKVSLKDSRLVVDYECTSCAHGKLSVEINLAMPSCDGPAGRFKVGNKIVGGFGQPYQIDSLKEIWLEDDVMGGKVRLSCDQSVRLRAWPHFSVSQSEAGFEKIMQAVTLVLDCDLADVGPRISIELQVI